jgi:hypothetical protein
MKNARYCRVTRGQTMDELRNRPDVQRAIASVRAVPKYDIGEGGGRY